jgi:hypothetical protein
VIKLEEIRKDTVLRGLEQAAPVKVVQLEWLGEDAVTVYYKDAAGRVAELCHDSYRWIAIEGRAAPVIRGEPIEIPRGHRSIRTHADWTRTSWPGLVSAGMLVPVAGGAYCRWRSRSLCCEERNLVDAGLSPSRSSPRSRPSLAERAVDGMEALENRRRTGPLPNDEHGEIWFRGKPREPPPIETFAGCQSREGSGLQREWFREPDQ